MITLFNITNSNKVEGEFKSIICLHRSFVENFIIKKFHLEVEPEDMNVETYDEEMEIDTRSGWVITGKLTFISAVPWLFIFI